MLLTRLVEHANQRHDLPPPNYRPRTIRWVLQLDSAGNPLTRTLHERSSSRGGSTPLNAPYVYRAGPRTPAFLLVDKLQYALGMPKEDGTKARSDAVERHDSYRQLLQRWADSYPDDAVAAAVWAFFGSGGVEQIAVPDGAKPSDFLGIQVDGQWAHEQSSAVDLWAQLVGERKGGSGDGLCLVCGTSGTLLETFPESIKSGAIPTGKSKSQEAQLVSINKAAQGRGGTTSLVNTPICENCGSRSIAALNALLTDRSHQQRWDDAVLVWWLREPIEVNPVWALCQEAPTPQELRAYLAQLWRPHRGGGVHSGPTANDFYGLTLSANQSRVVVRDWIDVPVEQVETQVAQWFDDQRIVDLWSNDEQVFPLWRLALAAARYRKTEYASDTIPHGLTRQLFSAAIRGTSLPAHILPHLLQRVRADARVDAPRMALLRLFLRRNIDASEETTLPGLNPDHPDPAYQCGRTLAVLESLQYRALGKNVNSTVTDRLFRRAVTSPRSALVAARKIAEGHLRKLRTSEDPKARAAGNALQARIEEVLTQTDTIPAVLDLAGQAQFLLGYHHQRAHDMNAAREAKAAGEANDAEDLMTETND